MWPLCPDIGELPEPELTHGAILMRPSPSQGIRRFALNCNLEDILKELTNGDRILCTNNTLTVCWQSLPVCPCLWRLWFSRIMIWKFDGSAAGAVQLASKTQPQKKGLGLICRGMHADLDSDCSDCSDCAGLCMLVDTWNMLKPDGCIKLNMMIHTYVHTYVYIYISLIGGKALGWNKRRNRCLANSNIDHLDPVWTLGFQNLFKLLSKQAALRKFVVLSTQASKQQQQQAAATSSNSKQQASSSKQAATSVCPLERMNKYKL